MMLGSCPLQTLALQGPNDIVVIHGRVEDAVSREPLPSTVVQTDDSTSVAYADSLGNFSIPMGATPPYVIHVAQFGYLPTTYELPADAPLRISILVLDPQPIAVEGVTVVEEAALTALVQRMDDRRNAYSGAVTVYDRDRMLGLGADSALELVERRSLAYECTNDLGQLCRRVRGREGLLLVCVDERVSLSAPSELDGIPIESVAFAEFYGPTVGFGLYGGPGAFATGVSALVGGRAYSAGQIRVYTRQWMVSTAGRQARTLWPAGFGC